MTAIMYKICFYVPVSHADEVKEALFLAGAGRIGDYEFCSWQVLGEGQFLPMKNSNPSIGRIGRLEQVREYKVEMVCGDDFIKDAINALISAHPYEEPAYQIVQVLTLSDLG